MSWSLFPYFAVVSLLLWILGAILAWKDRCRAVYALTISGIALFMAFIIGLWITLERPPMRTMGETRLWYTFFLPLAGIIVYGRWKYRWILSFSTLMAVVFTSVNLFRPEIHDKTLMPALQSPWFAPHVIVYMFAYALFGAAMVMAVYLLWFKRKPIESKEMALCDELTGTGLCFMTIGMLLGAIWAEQAWGHYWSWDPKETWAAATWLAYLVYIHLRRDKTKVRLPLYVLVVAFVCLQLCWWGINYLPSARGVSIHSYGM